MYKYYDAIDILKRMVSLPSLSREETAVADFLQKKWKDDGHVVNRTGNNLWLINPDFDKHKVTLLLNAHIDTVRPSTGWTTDPYQAVLSEDGTRLYGLGTNDDGASVVSLYAAYCFLKDTEQSYNLIFLASAEEEVSGKGGIECVLDDLPPIDFAVVGEPTGMNPAIAEKGLMVLDCTSRGVSGHAAREEGVNAITLAMKDIGWFTSHKFENVSEVLGGVKMSVTMINAGTQHNVIPSECIFTVDVRSNECYSNEDLYKEICNAVSCEVKARSFRLNSSKTPLGHAIISRAEMLGKVAFGSPTLSDQALLSCPSVKIGPGDSSRSHTANEYIELMEIREAIDIYIKLLDGLVIA